MADNCRADARSPGTGSRSARAPEGASGAGRFPSRLWGQPWVHRALPAPSAHPVPPPLQVFQPLLQRLSGKPEQQREGRPETRGSPPLLSDPGRGWFLGVPPEHLSTASPAAPSSRRGEQVCARDATSRTSLNTHTQSSLRQLLRPPRQHSRPHAGHTATCATKEGPVTVPVTPGPQTRVNVESLPSHAHEQIPRNQKAARDTLRQEVGPGLRTPPLVTLAWRARPDCEPPPEVLGVWGGPGSPPPALGTRCPVCTGISPESPPAPRNACTAPRPWPRGPPRGSRPKSELSTSLSL